MQRTRISPSGMKLGRKMTGPAVGAAIKVDDHASVEQAVVIGEGLETVLTGMLYGLRPAWGAGVSRRHRILPFSARRRRHRDP